MQNTNGLFDKIINKFGEISKKVLSPEKIESVLAQIVNPNGKDYHANLMHSVALTSDGGFEFPPNVPIEEKNTKTI